MLGSIRAMSRSFSTPTHILPFAMKQRPPIIRFSSNATRRCFKQRRTRVASCSLYAIVLAETDVRLHRFAGPFDPELLHPTAKSAGVQVQDSGRAAFAFNHPVGLAEHGL